MAVTYNELVDIILLESGQFIADLDATLLDEAKLTIMIKRELGLYSRYNPRIINQTMILFNGKTFTKEADGFIPNALTSIRTDKFDIMGYQITPYPGAVHSFYWRYEKPVLHTRYPEGSYQVTGITAHEYDETNKRIDSIEIHDKFITMLVARFLITVGKSRRAFTLSDILINVDADSMIADGTELYNTTVEEIKINSTFNLALLV